MRVKLFSFQQSALEQLREATHLAIHEYKNNRNPQIVSYTAPTGAGKTIILASLIESIYCGDIKYNPQPNAIFVWLSDSPQLNQQSKDKIDDKADRLTNFRTITIEESSFDGETLEDGCIYFLNTQKLSTSSNLTKQGDSRQYTIWETLANTANTKFDHLYFIIDEAHRGMQGREASKATTIMQKFLKGSPDNNLPPMPVVIGVTATIERFHNLVSKINPNLRSVTTEAKDVINSGLLKDRIVITYPDALNSDMAVLQAATDDWQQKWLHWEQYCREQHYAYVNPVFLIQAEAGTSSKVSNTDLDEALRIIEERSGCKFRIGEVVHTFDKKNAIKMNGLDVIYVEPSHIADDRQIKVVFFKENLSTGWDCPRAETMMSFRKANDSTYIAQLLGRMVRTPMHMHINVDESLNDVHLFLPFFNSITVQEVVEALQGIEGGSIPTDIYGESITQPTYQVFGGNQGLTQKTTKPKDASTQTKQEDGGYGNLFTPTSQIGTSITNPDTAQHPTKASTQQSTVSKPEIDTIPQEEPTVTPEIEVVEEHIDSTTIINAINEANLLTYDIRTVVINDYYKSMFALARLLSQNATDTILLPSIKAEIVDIIHSHIEYLKAEGVYDERVQKIEEFRLSEQVFDVFGETINNNQITDLFSTTDVDVDNRYNRANQELGGEGIGVAYGQKYIDYDNQIGFKLDIIIFAQDDEGRQKIEDYAKAKYYDIIDNYRNKANKFDDTDRHKWNRYVSDGALISEHSFHLDPTFIHRYVSASEGTLYKNHLFADSNGNAYFKFNDWESGLIEEEQKRSDFVCWLRNPTSKGVITNLRIPYEDTDGVTRAFYPDFLVIRKDTDGDFLIDILEPHNPDFADNLPKAKGFAKYAQRNTGASRLQLIHKIKKTGKEYFYRLDMGKIAVRERVLKCVTPQEFNNIFEEYGIIEYL